MRKVITLALSVFKYLIALFMLYAGAVTLIAAGSPGESLGLFYENSSVLTMFGLLFFASGGMLLVGKIAKKDRLTGYGLFLTYSCFLFAAIANWVANGFYAASGNLIGALIVGGLYLRWKYHIYYYDRSCVSSESVLP